MRSGYLAILVTCLLSCSGHAPILHRCNSKLRVLGLTLEPEPPQRSDLGPSTSVAAVVTTKIQRRLQLLLEPIHSPINGSREPM